MIAKRYGAAKIAVLDVCERYLRFRGDTEDGVDVNFLKTRIKEVGAKGLLFNSSESLDIEDLLAHPTVLELEALSDDDDKAFVVGLLLTLISEYRQTHNPSLDPFAEPGSALQHVLVIEEAHRLLKNVAQERQTEQLGNPRGKAVEFFANVISEMRSMGQGVAVVEQIPSKLLPDVIKNTNTKIVHRLVSRDDQALLASTLGLEDHEALYLTSLRTGHALYAREGMQRPIEVKIKPTVTSTRISHDRVRRKMLHTPAVDTEGNATAMAVRDVLGPDGCAVSLRFLCTLACGEPLECPGYADKAVAQVESLLLQRDHKSSESSIKSFLSTGLIELLANGVFRLKDGAVRGVASVVARLLDGDDRAGSDFQERLAQGWQTDTRDGAIHRIRELALDRALRARVALDDAVINQIVATYFIADISAARREIASQVMERIGGSTWTR